MRSILVSACLLAILVGCGGGGSAGPIFLPPPVDLGLVPANAPTTFTVEVVNPYTAPAGVTFVTSAPGLGVSSSLPVQVPASGRVDVDVALSPGIPGAYSGSVTFRVDAGSQASDQTTAVTANAEAATASVSTSAIDFGSVAPGEVADRFVTFTNTSGVSTVTISSASVPGPAYALLAPTLPASVPPGSEAVLQVRYAPDSLDTADGTLTLGTNAANGPFRVALRASGIGGQEVITFEDVLFDGSGDTPVLTFDVPSDAISFMIEGSTGASTELGLRLLTGPGGKVYENESLSGAYVWAIQPGIFTAQVPNTDRNDVQLVPGGGTYRMRLLRWSGNSSSVDVRVIIERRPDAATRNLATLDLNVFLAAGIAPTAATAESDGTLQTVLSTVDSILSQQGIQIGDIDYYDVTDTRFDDVSFSEFGDLLEESARADEVRLNLFFVRTAIGGGILGVSPALGGPALNGTSLSGVMSLYSTNNPAFIGLVAAHEIGHFLGLAHTVEQTGSHDDITDTLECPSSGTNALCTTQGGGYLMHWQAVGGTDLSNGQGLVVRGHPHMGPRAGGANALQAKPTAAPRVPIPADAPQHWCATCRAMHGVRLK
ncbi:MAG: choice-of-anchor D domain-containing protein [Planctomycetota bacterium]|nr:choice-of-anchor D domain-containing protein [Planctomycetota bacterium]